METERLLLRRFSDKDCEAFFALYSDPRITQYTARGPLSSREETLDFLSSGAFRLEEESGLGRFACVEKTTAKVVGLVGLKWVPDLDCVDIGFRFLPEVWGRGLATEAAAAVMKYGQEALHIERIVATVFPGNKNSARVLEKIGLSFKRKVRLKTMNEDLLLYE